MLLNTDVPRGMGATAVRSVILDWAGTTVDFGSLAPVRTLERVFQEAGVPILEEEARRDMGIAKRDHIAALLGIARVRQAWNTHYGCPPTPADVDHLYESFKPLQMDCLKQYCTVLPGVPELTDRLRTRGILIGSTTGYTRPMLDVLVEEAAKQRYRPDCSFCPEDVGAGRPYPFMLYAAAVKMKVFPLGAMVKVGDTVSDIQEGLNSGMWSVGVAGTGNGVGISEDAFRALSPNEQDSRVTKAKQELAAAGAHYVIASLAELDGVLDDIEGQLGKEPLA